MHLASDESDEQIFLDMILIMLYRLFASVK